MVELQCFRYGILICFKYTVEMISLEIVVLYSVCTCQCTISKCSFIVTVLK